MNRLQLAACAFVCAALALTGCDSGRQAPGKVTVRVANAAPGFSVLKFRREQSSRSENEADLVFKGVGDFVFDAGSYDFFVFESSLDPNAPGRTWTFAPQLEEDNGYVFVLTEVGGEVAPVVLSYSAPPAADTQIVGLHAATGAPAIDLYLERPGVGIAGATPRGTFGAQGQIGATVLPSGDYELTLTAAGDPATVLLTTPTITLPAGGTSGIVVVPEGGQSAQLLSVLLLQGTSTVQYDRTPTTELRVVNAATDQAPRDVAIDNQFSPPLFSAVPFAEPTAYVQTPIGARPVAVTPVGNPGVLEVNDTYTGVVDRRVTMLVAGPAGALLHVFAPDDLRRIHNEAKLRFMNAATQFPLVDFVLTGPGADPATVTTPLATLAAPAISLDVSAAPGEYDLYLRPNASSTLLSGPTRITVAAEGIYGVLAVNGPDTATAGVVLFDDFP